MKVLCDKPNKVFKLVKFMRNDGKDINGGGCKKDKDGRLVVSECRKIGNGITSLTGRLMIV